MKHLTAVVNFKEARNLQNLLSLGSKLNILHKRYYEKQSELTKKS